MISDDCSRKYPRNTSPGGNLAPSRIGKTSNRFRSTAGLLALLTFLFGAAPSAAVDGVIEINQARAEAGDVTPTDAPGFPVTISEAGSYKLTGKLTVPNADTSGIEITAENVVIDFNGFGIFGPVNCTGSVPTCTTAGGLGAGVRVVANKVRVFNGTIQGLGGSGIFSPGGNTETWIEDMTITSNFGRGFLGGSRCTLLDNTITNNLDDGIEAGGQCRITGNIITNNGITGISVSDDNAITENLIKDNGSTGINVSGGNVVQGNTVTANASDGINASGGVLIGNTVSLNDGVGVQLSSGVGFVNNVVSLNSGGNAAGGTQLGQNLCGTALCP